MLNVRKFTAVSDGFYTNPARQCFKAFKDVCHSGQLLYKLSSQEY